MLRRMSLRFLPLLLVVGLGSGGLAAAPAQAAYPTSTFYVSYGNSSVRGTITWYNRSVTFSGVIKSGGECRYAFVRAWNSQDANSGSSSRTFGVCGGDSQTFERTFSRVGGYDLAYVLLQEYDAYLYFTNLGEDHCWRFWDACHTIF